MSVEYKHYFVTNSVEGYPHWEADSSLPGEKNPHVLWKAS
jgi:hypothetical protein